MAFKSDAGFLPPVMISADDPAERAHTLAFFDHYIGQNRLEVAATEQKRLSYYFEALDQRFAAATPESKGGPAKPFSLITFITPPAFRDHKPQDVYEKGALTNIFQRIAQQTRSIILSEVMILPHSFVSDPELFSRKEIYSGGVATTALRADAHDTRGYHFGFYDVRQHASGADTQWYKYESDIALPVLALDDNMMKPLAPHNPEPLLRALQSVVTYCNHDMMHNMVNTTTKGDISRLTESRYKQELDLFMEHKTGRFSPDDVLGFESALVIGHARTWQHLKDTAVGDNLKQAITHYYDALTQITTQLKTEALDADTQHQIVDYYAMAVPFALARMVPLHDALMDYALARAEQVTPDIARVRAQDHTIDDHDKHSKTAKTVQYYRKAGRPLAADESAPQDYAAIKKLQLARMVPDLTILLAPAPPGSETHKAHARADEMDRDIANIILRHTQAP